MNNIKDELGNFSKIAKAIASHFGEKCEVVIHDLTDGIESTIVAIENEHVTGRKIGDCGSNIGLELLRGTVKDDDRYNYITQSKDGRILRSTSICLTDNHGEIIGAMCINFDISELLVAEQTIKSLSMHGFNQHVKENFVTDVNELLDYLLQECQNEIGKPVSSMSKEEKQKAIEYLDQKGAFLIKKSVDRVCEFFDFSKYTLYGYLDVIRREPNKKSHV